jgi:hypothetical protein
MESTFGGKKPIALPNGETRSSLMDGDILVLRLMKNEYLAKF